MISDYLILGGYGMFVWSAFIFTFVCCLFLYLRTRKVLRIQEKMLLSESKILPITKIETAGRKAISKEVLSGVSII
jgi:heme exporter protein D